MPVRPRGGNTTLLVRLDVSVLVTGVGRTSITNWGREHFTRLVVIGLVTVVVNLAIIGSVGPFTPPQISPPAASSESDSGPQTPTGIQSPASVFNTRLVEAHLIEIINRERSRRGLGNLTIRRELQLIAENHSQSMANHEYLEHEEPDGTGIADRYRALGLLPECRLAVPWANGSFPGAENIAQTWVGRPVRADWAESGRYRIETNRELAFVLFQMWMHSESHRKTLLLPAADEAGFGMAFAAAGKVYASLEFC